MLNPNKNILLLLLLLLAGTYCAGQTKANEKEPNVLTVEINYIESQPGGKASYLSTQASVSLQNNSKSSYWVLFPKNTDHILEDTISMLKNVRDIYRDLDRDRDGITSLHLYAKWPGSYKLYHLRQNEKVNIPNWSISSRKEVSPFSMWVIEDLLMEEVGGASKPGNHSINEIELFKFLGEDRDWENPYESPTTFYLHFKNVVQIYHFNFLVEGNSFGQIDNSCTPCDEIKEAWEYLQKGDFNTAMERQSRARLFTYHVPYQCGYYMISLDEAEYDHKINEELNSHIRNALLWRYEDALSSANYYEDSVIASMALLSLTSLQKSLFAEISEWRSLASAKDVKSGNYLEELDYRDRGLIKQWAKYSIFGVDTLYTYGQDYFHRCLGSKKHIETLSDEEIKELDEDDLWKHRSKSGPDFGIAQILLERACILDSTKCGYRTKMNQLIKERGYNWSTVIRRKRFETIVTSCIATFNEKKVSEFQSEEHVEMMLALNTIQSLSKLPAYNTGIYLELTELEAQINYTEKLKEVFPNWLGGSGGTYYYPDLKMELCCRPRAQFIYEVVD